MLFIEARQAGCRAFYKVVYFENNAASFIYRLSIAARVNQFAFGASSSVVFNFVLLQTKTTTSCYELEKIARFSAGLLFCFRNSDKSFRARPDSDNMTTEKRLDGQSVGPSRAAPATLSTLGQSCTTVKSSFFKLKLDMRS